MATEQLALHLDSYTNNSCLALAIELVESGKVLLFPGDAQFGNWISWKDLSWDILDKNGLKVKVTMADLLNQTVFYKVGHHGSHNATLREHGLEMMNNPELVAMIPVDRDKAKDKKWEMPEGHLFKRLQEKAKGRVIIADEQDKNDLEQRCIKNNLLTAEREKFLQNVDFSSEASLHLKPLYVEYVIEG
jgi:predicted GNAT family N-acyltransferase